jgi:hypothetical protein
MRAELSVQHIPMRLAPLLGAAALALTSAGVTDNPAVVERLAASYAAINRPLDTAPAVVPSR